MSKLKLYPNLEKSYLDLQIAWQKKSLPSTLLFVGKAGVGKKKVLLELAKLLCCEKSTEIACGQCFSCLNVKEDTGQEDAGETPYLWLPPLEGTGKELDSLDKRNEKTVESSKRMVLDPYRTGIIGPNAAHRIDSVRDLRKKMSFQSDRVQVVIIPEADKMSPSVANSLLKTLEETPVRTFFLMTTSNPSRILPTILSRALKVRVPSLSVKDFVKVAGDFGSYEASQLENLYHFSEGAPGFCLSLSGEVLERIENQSVEFLKLAFTHRSDLLLDWIEKSEFHLDKGDGLKQLSLFWRMLSFLMSQFVRKSQGLPILWNAQEGEIDELFEKLPSVELIPLFMIEINKAAQCSNSVRPLVRLSRLGLSLSHLITSGQL